jgi:hypothetical protein
LNLIWIMPAQGERTQHNPVPCSLTEGAKMTPTTPALPDAAATPATFTSAEFGIGARVTLAVMSERYADIILDAIRTTDPTGLTLDTGVVSTFVGGAEADIVRYLTGLIAAAGQFADDLAGAAAGEVHSGTDVRAAPAGGAGPLRSEIPERLARQCHCARLPRLPRRGRLRTARRRRPAPQ